MVHSPEDHEPTTNLWGACIAYWAEALSVSRSEMRDVRPRCAHDKWAGSSRGKVTADGPAILIIYPLNPFSGVVGGRNKSRGFFVRSLIQTRMAHATK